MPLLRSTTVRWSRPAVQRGKLRVDCGLGFRRVELGEVRKVGVDGHGEGWGCNERYVQSMTGYLTYRMPLIYRMRLTRSNLLTYSNLPYPGTSFLDRPLAAGTLYIIRSALLCPCRLSWRVSISPYAGHSHNQECLYSVTLNVTLSSSPSIVTTLCYILILKE
jgi:hypothetical protein